MAQTTGPTGAAPPASAPAPTASTSSGKYSLLAPHVINDAWLPIGTEIGTGTPYPFPGAPSIQMAGIDDAGKAAVAKLFQELYGMKPPWDSDDPVVKDHLAQYTGDQALQQKEAQSEPVSVQQAFERGAKEYGGKPVPLQMPGPPSPMPLSGDRSVYIGTARQF